MREPSEPFSSPTREKDNNEDKCMQRKVWEGQNWFTRVTASRFGLQDSRVPRGSVYNSTETPPRAAAGLFRERLHNVGSGAFGPEIAVPRPWWVVLDQESKGSPAKTRAHREPQGLSMISGTRRTISFVAASNREANQSTNSGCTCFGTQIGHR